MTGSSTNHKNINKGYKWNGVREKNESRAVTATKKTKFD